MTVALSISGSSRSPLALQHFADALVLQFIRPALHTHEFDSFVWLGEDVAEKLLCQRLESHVRRCASRIEAFRKSSELAVDETAAIARDHAPPMYANAWRDNTTVNTIRMLWKLRGVERVRRLMTLGTSRYEYDWVLRVRPDLELLSPLMLPPPAPIVYVPWRCESSQLVFDQLLLLPGGAEARLAALYSPKALALTARQSEPPSLYPERLFHHALQGLELREWPGGAPSRLVAANGDARDAYGKLRADFPACFATSNMA